MAAEVFPPGNFIKEEIEARNWIQSDLAKILGKSLRLVNELINNKRTITPETAKALSSAFGTSAILWMNLESAWQLHNMAATPKTCNRRVEKTMATPPHLPTDTKTTPQA